MNNSFDPQGADVSDEYYLTVEAAWIDALKKLLVGSANRARISEMDKIYHYGVNLDGLEQNPDAIKGSKMIRNAAGYCRCLVGCEKLHDPADIIFVGPKLQDLL